jgi:hypothetical protein
MLRGGIWISGLQCACGSSIPRRMGATRCSVERSKGETGGLGPRASARECAESISMMREPSAQDEEVVRSDGSSSLLKVYLLERSTGSLACSSTFSNLRNGVGRLQGVSVNVGQVRRRCRRGHTQRENRHIDGWENSGSRRRRESEPHESKSQSRDAFRYHPRESPGII